MIDPVNLFSVDNIKGKNGVILTLEEIPLYDQEDYDLSDSREFNRYLKDIEKCVRGSYEYRELIKYLHEYGKMWYSGTYENIVGLNSGVKIEIHHTPFSLYDIVTIVYDKRAFYHEDLSVEMVAKEVMELHYKSLVGLYPLTQTEHQLVHNGFLFIPTSYVYGRYDLFLSLYNEFINDEMKETLLNIEEYTKIAYNESTYKSLLSQSNIYLDTSGSYSLPILDDLKLALTDRVSQIKQNAFMLPIFDEDVITNPMDEMNKELKNSQKKKEVLIFL